MTVLQTHRTSNPASVDAIRRRPDYQVWLTAAEGLGLAGLVGYSGTPGWQASRLILVMLLFGGAIRLQRSRRTWIVGGVSIATGMIGTVAGIGIGLMNLIKAGPAVLTVFGLIVLATGVVLLLVGSTTFVRLLPRRLRLLAVPSAYIVIEFVLFPVTAGVYAANAPAGHIGAANPSSRGLAYSTVAFPASDGIRLSAWYVPSRNGAAVVVVPGSGSTRAAVLDQGAVLARHGYGVLFLDNRGHGTSRGTSMDFGWWGERDLSGAVTYLETRTDVTKGRIAILGESMGGEEAIGAIGADTRVRAVIAEGVTGRTFADTARLGHGFTNLVSRAQSWVTYTTAAALTDAPQPLSLRTSLLRASPRPVLIIAGKSEISASRYLKSNSPSNVELLELRDTAHTAGLQAHPTQWEQTVIDFLRHVEGL